MDAISLLFCDVKRRPADELPIWVLMAAFAIVAIEIQEREVLLVLWIAMLLGWCIREQATANAKKIRAESSYMNAVAVMVIIENRARVWRMISVAAVMLLNVRRYARDAFQAALAHLGLTHYGLAPRLLPIPELSARQ